MDTRTPSKKASMKVMKQTPPKQARASAAPSQPTPSSSSRKAMKAAPTAPMKAMKSSPMTAKKQLRAEDGEVGKKVHSVRKGWSAWAYSDRWTLFSKLRGESDSKCGDRILEVLDGETQQMHRSLVNAKKAGFEGSYSVTYLRKF